MADKDNASEAEILSPFAKDKKTPAKKTETSKMRSSTHVSTLPPAQNLFGRLIQTLNAANTQNVRSKNPGWDVTAAAVKRAGKVEKVMGEFKRKELHSGKPGPGKGPKVKSRDQAIAIALSEAREAGENVPKLEKSSMINEQVLVKLADALSRVRAAASVAPSEMVVEAEDAYLSGFMLKLAQSGMDDAQQQGFLASLRESFTGGPDTDWVGRRPGESWLQGRLRSWTAMPRWMARNPGKTALAGLAVPALAPFTLPFAAYGAMTKKRHNPTLQETLELYQRRNPLKG